MEWSYEFGRRAANGTCFRISFPEMRFFYGPIVLWILVLDGHSTGICICNNLYAQSCINNGLQADLFASGSTPKRKVNQ